MGFVQLAEIRQFLHAGPAVGGPEVDEHWLSAVIGKVEFASVQARDCEVLQLLPDFAPLRRIARPVCRSCRDLLCSVRGRLLVEGLQHLRRDGAALIVHDLTVPVQDNGLRHGGGSAHQIPDHFVVVFHGKWHHPVASVLVQIFLRFLVHDVGMQGQHRDIALMGFVKLTEIRQFLHAGSAVCGPEVDEHGLTAVVGQVELASVQACDREVLELLPDFAALGRGARPVCRSRFLCRRFRLRSNGFIGGCFRLPDVGVEEVIVGQCRAQDRKRNPPGDLPELFALCFGIGSVVRAAACRRLQGNASGPEADRLLITHIHAFGAVNTLVVAHMPHVHAAAAHTGSAVVAAGGVHLYAHNRDLAEKAVDCAQRTYETAETAVAEHAGQSDDEHDDKLSREQDVQHPEIAGIGGI